MRRIAALSVGIALIMTIGAGVSLAVGEYYLDKFDSGNYSGSQGNVAWSGPWTEVDSGGGGSSGGNVKVTSSGCTGNCLSMSGALAQTFRALRGFSLDGYVDATLSYKLDVASLLGLGSVNVYIDDGSRKLVRTHPIAVPGQQLVVPVSLSSFAGQSSLKVEFELQQLVGSQVLIDDVRIDLVPAPPPTTTTTTSTTSTTTTTVTLPPTTLPTIPSVTTTTLPGGSGLPTSSTTTSTIPGETTTSSTINGSGGGGSSGGGAPPSSGSGNENGTPTGQPDAGTTAPAGGPDGRLVVAPIALDVRPGNSTGPLDILDADYSADFSLAAEVFDLLGSGPLLLAGVISALALVGIDRRRAPIALGWRRSDNDS